MSASGRERELGRKQRRMLVRQMSCCACSARSSSAFLCSIAACATNSVASTHATPNACARQTSCAHALQTPFARMGATLSAEKGKTWAGSRRKESAKVRAGQWITAPDVRILVYEGSTSSKGSLPSGPAFIRRLRHALARFWGCRVGRARRLRALTMSGCGGGGRFDATPTSNAISDTYDRRLHHPDNRA
eukprot:2650608-Pleurochrysis_carterae.AAC.1